MTYYIKPKKIKEFCKFKRIAKKLSKTEWELLKEFCRNREIINEFYYHGDDTLKEWSEYVARRGLQTKLKGLVDNQRLNHDYSKNFAKAFHKYLSIHVA